MKLVSLLVIALSSSAALAQTSVPSTVPSSGQASAEAATTSSNLTPAKPLRQAKAHGTIYKTTSSLSPVKISQEKVCDFNADIPVYDFVAADQSASLATAIVCDSTVDGKAVKVELSADMSYVALSALAPASKSAEAILNVYAPDTGTTFLQQSASAGSADLKVKSLQLSMGSPTFTSGGTPNQESFATFATFDDANQPLKSPRKDVKKPVAK